MTAGAVVDLCAGPGGWDVGARALGLDPVGLELDRDACATRRAAGLRTVRADVDRLPLAGVVDGLIASPPCPDFSTAGRGAGLAGATGRLSALIPEWAALLRPRWVACEQVPLALPVWESNARALAALGYSTWAGLLNAADYGVPQDRTRAFLIARLDGPACPPPATHADPARGPSLFLSPWVSMRDAVGWVEVNTGRRWAKGGTRGEAQTVPGHRPAPTFTAGNGRQWQARLPADGDRPFGPGWAAARRAAGGEPIAVDDAGRIQGFPGGYPWQGTRTSRFHQIGNAVPPPLASAVLTAASGARPCA